MSSEWLTAGEAASYLKVEPRTLLMWTIIGRGSEGLRSQASSVLPPIIEYYSVEIGFYKIESAQDGGPQVKVVRLRFHLVQVLFSECVP